MVYPSKNGWQFACDRPMYHSKSFCQTPIPERNVLRIAFRRDLVVLECHPQELRIMSPLFLIVVIRLPCRYTCVSPASLTRTMVLDLHQSLRLAIAAVISRSILRMMDQLEMVYREPSMCPRRVCSDWHSSSSWMNGLSSARSRAATYAAASSCVSWIETMCSCVGCSYYRRDRHQVYRGCATSSTG